MKKILYIFLFSLLISSNVFSQDSRHRTHETVVADVLAQLPSADKEKFNKSMLELALDGKESIKILNRLFVPYSEGNNSCIEYAISGLVSFVTSEGNDKYKVGVREGLRSAIKECSFIEGKAFLITQLQLCSEYEDIDVFIDYVNDDKLASYAINAIINTNGSERVIMDLVRKNGASPVSLAYAVREKRLTEAESYLLALAAKKLNTEERKMIYSALGVCGTEKSMKLLSVNSVRDYLVLLKNLSLTSSSKKVMSEAKKLMKNDNPYIRSNAAEILIIASNGNVKKELFSAMKDESREYRVAFLDFMYPYMTDEKYDYLSDNFGKFLPEAQEDYIKMLGHYEVESQKDFLIQTVRESKDSTVVSEAIIALGNFEGGDVVEVLISNIGGQYDSAAYKALSCSKTDISKGILSVLENGNKMSVISALRLASAKRIKEASDIVFKLLSSNDNDIRKTAYSSLYGVVTENDIKRISEMVNATEVYTVDIQKAFESAIKTLNKDRAYEITVSQMQLTENRAFYYPVLSSIGTDKAADKLIEEFNEGKNKEKALSELINMNNSSIIDFLYDVIDDRAFSSNSVVNRYINLIKDSKMSYAEKYKRLSDISSLDCSEDIKKNILLALTAIPTENSFNMAVLYLNDESVSYQAAMTVKQIASNKLSVIDYSNLKSGLEKAMKIYEKSGQADDIYAIDEIKKILNVSKPVELFVLSDEEKKLGFEVLFDGTDLSKWEGDTLGYKAVNGAINVSAEYGNSHNLYTKEEYSDFIFRFEFCFKTPAVNNGVGIRTPKDVDAAYFGMCEVQILDHDHAAYKGIAEYQTHGSVYGIIPAKRIKHKPLGEWSTEEIKVKGDHITVTVNGEVILDGNVREACGGHNVSHDNSDKNPYTADKRNHPGLFNKKGHISFCGHGTGIAFRNIRILDLNKK